MGLKMKLRYIISITILVSFLIVTTCNHYMQKKNQQRVILDDKAVGYKNGVNYGTHIPDSSEPYCLTMDVKQGSLKVSYAPSIWIDSWYPKTKSRSGITYNDLIQLNDNQYLFVGKDGFGKTFDSTIITINK